MVSFLFFMVSMLMAAVRSQTNSTTPVPTIAPTDIYECECETYVVNNLTNSDGDGCISGEDICVTCDADVNECTCVQSEWCELFVDIVKAIGTVLIIVIVVSSVCALCIIGGCIYCCFCK